MPAKIYTKRSEATDIQEPERKPLPQMLYLSIPDPFSKTGTLRTECNDREVA